MVYPMLMGVWKCFMRKSDGELFVTRSGPSPMLMLFADN